jgi:curved DNA-binding protein CbpA
VARDREPWEEEWHDYYAVLGIPDYQVRSASSQIIERLFRSRVQVVHPDALPPGAPDTDRRLAQEDFKVLVAARDVLVDRERRGLYDHAYRQRRAGIYRPKPPLLSKRRLSRLPLDQLILAGLTVVGLIAGLIYLLLAG